MNEVLSFFIQIAIAIYLFVGLLIAAYHNEDTTEPDAKFLLKKLGIAVGWPILLLGKGGFKRLAGIIFAVFAVLLLSAFVFI